MHTDSQSRAVDAADKQRRLPPRNGTPAAKCGALSVFVADQWCNCSDIGHGVRWKRSPCCEVMFIPRRTRVVGREEACRSEAVVHLPEIRGARKYVVARIKGVEAKAVANAEFNPGARHELHQAHSAARRDCMLVASAFNLDDGTNPARRHGKTIGGFLDEVSQADRLTVARDRYCADAVDAKPKKAAVGNKNSAIAAKLRAIGESEPKRLDARSSASA